MNPERRDGQGLGPERKGPENLRDVLIDATLDPNIAIKDGITSIDLGVFGKTAEQLLASTLKDPLRRERLKIVYVTRDRRVLLQRRAKIENPRLNKPGVQSVSFVIEASICDNFRNTSRCLRQDRFFATAIHSHPDSYPSSFADLKGLVSGEFSLGVSPSAFIIGPERKMLIFRTSKTPFLPEEVISEVEAVYDNSRETWFEALKCQVDPELLVSGEIKFQADIIRFFSQIFNFRRYSCPVNRNIASLEC